MASVSPREVDSLARAGVTAVACGTCVGNCLQNDGLCASLVRATTVLGQEPTAEAGGVCTGNCLQNCGLC